ncbi:glycosyltransferase family 2 protein [Flavobacterium sp. XS1P27]|uniref:glycosyltransferase family 2 protein n=1 Tax=Flavobacterium sp. XS1P27 TaxID=3401724 RepID=UPI003AB10673
MTFSISVIIPAYNVEQFIETAIVSALQQPEVIEIVVVDDGSTDNTLQIIKTLQVVNAKIKIFHHENHINKGRSATRNLGIQKATGDYIAFLDADDYYLEHRFRNDVKIFQGNKNCDGVYNAVGFHFYRQVTPLELDKLKVSTVSKKLRPNELFDGIVSSKYGYLHLNGITIKKTVFDCIGYFNESLMVAEDSDIIFKMALKCFLLPSEIHNPVAKRGIHDVNIYSDEALYKVYNVKLFKELLEWSYQNGIAIKNKDTLLKWLWFFKFRDGNSLWNHIIFWGYLVGGIPELLFSILSIKYFPIIRQRQILFPFLYQKN